MSRITIRGGADLKSRSPGALGASDWKELAFEDILRFAEATGDRQWIHVDRERIARESPYGVPIAHGYFSLSRVAALFFEILELEGFANVINYGCNKVRFPAPLRVGSRYRLVLALLETRELAGGTEAAMSATIEIEGESKPACAAEIVFRLMD